MRRLIYSMNVSLDGYIAAPGDDLRWGVPDEELFQYFTDQVRTTGVAGATLAGAAMRAGLVDEYQVAVYPVLICGGTSYFTSLDSWVNLRALEPRRFPDGVQLLRYETRH